MKAIVQFRYGPPEMLKWKEVDKPVPGDHQVLVRVMASSLNFADVVMIEGGPWFARPVTMFMKPGYRIPGTNIAGRVVETGPAVEQFAAGDEVFGNTCKCGRGGFAEYACVPQEYLAKKPASLSFEEAASLPESAGMAVQGLCDLGGLRSGMKVLIQGASGGIGTIAVQVAKAMGAEVTGVCSGRNIELVRSLGADHVIDYTREDFTRGEERYDLILGIKGYHPLRDYEKALTPDGIYVMAGGSWRQIFEGGARASRGRRNGEKTVKAVSFEMRQKDLVFIRELVEAGLVRAVIDRVYAIEDIARAVRYFDKGRSRGKVVLVIRGDQ